MLVYSPLSTMSQVPSQDLRDLQAIVQRLDAGKEAYHPEPVHPSNTAKDAWRQFLRMRLAEQGWAADEVTIEALHCLGWRTTMPVDVFLEHASRAEGGHSVCLGVGVPYVMTLACRREGQYKVMGIEKYQTFVVASNVDARQLTLRPLVCRDYPGLVRPSEWPKSMANSRVPREQNIKLYIDAGRAPRWAAAWDCGRQSGSVSVEVAIVELPSGSFGWAMPGDSPLSSRPRSECFNITGDVGSKTYFELKVSAEARQLLRGAHPGWQRIRDLDIFQAIPTLGSHFLKGGTVNARHTLQGNPEVDEIMDDIELLINTCEHANTEEEREDRVASLMKLSEVG